MERDLQIVKCAGGPSSPPSPDRRQDLTAAVRHLMPSPPCTAAPSPPPSTVTPSPPPSPHRHDLTAPSRHATTSPPPPAATTPPASPPLPTVTPSQPPTATVGHHGPPPPPPRTAGGRTARRASASRNRPEEPLPPPRLLRPSEDGVTVTWGRKKKPNGGRRRPRPIGGVYRKYQAPMPRGRPRPDPVPLMRLKGVDPVLHGSNYVVPKRAVSRNFQIDSFNQSLCDTYSSILAAIKRLEEHRKMSAPSAEVTSALLYDISRFCNSAFALRRVVLGLGAKPVNEPMSFKRVCPKVVN